MSHVFHDRKSVKLVELQLTELVLEEVMGS